MKRKSFLHGGIYGRRTPRIAVTILILLSLIFIVSRSSSIASERKARHDLRIELHPSEKRLSAVDEIAMGKIQSDLLCFKLTPRAENIRVALNGKSRNIDFMDGRLCIRLSNPEQNKKVNVTLRYTAVFDDPVPDRPLNTDNPGFGVSATISERGSFLLAGSGWYPERIGEKSEYWLEVIAPVGMIAVTAGQSQGHFTQNGKTHSTWLIKDATRGLALSVGPYVIRENQIQTTTAATYFYKESDHLANAYLEATADYLSLYQGLFGPYPFEKFAVVENFFPTGFGFPSYTLIGSTVLRLPFIIQTSLGHEIAHCWWGNGVQVDYEEGNWCEALTTYVADYLYQEKKSAEDARRYRLQILRAYSTLISADNDFALKQFQTRFDPASKTIGYDKGMMVFHMLRKRLGEEAFWGALRDLYRQRLFKMTSWRDLQSAFERRGEQSLQSFFDQWVSRKGAPHFRLEAVQSKQKADAWKIEGRVVQRQPAFRFDLALMLQTSGNEVHQIIRVTDGETPFQMIAQSRPIRLVADPDSDVFRRLFPEELPPAINALKSSTSLLAVLSDDLGPEIKTAARNLILSLGIQKFQLAKEKDIRKEALIENDLLVVGYPQPESFFRDCPPQFEIRKKSFMLNEKIYDRPTDAFFGVFSHPFAEGRIAALFIPLSPGQADTVARKITHYGKYSYLAFRDGQNQDKGFWSIAQSPLEYRWGNETQP